MSIRAITTGARSFPLSGDYDVVVELKCQQGEVLIVKAAIVNFLTSKYSFAQLHLFVGGSEFAFGGESTPIETDSALSGWHWDGEVTLRGGDRLVLEARTNENADIIQGVVFYDIEVISKIPPTTPITYPECKKW